MIDGKNKDFPYSVYDEATPQQKSATRCYIESRFDGDERLEYLQALGLEPYARTVTNSANGRTRVVGVQ